MTVAACDGIGLVDAMDGLVAVGWTAAVVGVLAGAAAVAVGATAVGVGVTVIALVAGMVAVDFADPLQAASTSTTAVTRRRYGRRLIAL